MQLCFGGRRASTHDQATLAVGEHSWQAASEWQPASGRRATHNQATLTVSDCNR